MLNKYGLIYIIQALQILGFKVEINQTNQIIESIEDVIVNKSNKSVMFEEYFNKGYQLDYDYFENTVKNPSRFNVIQHTDNEFDSNLSLLHDILI